MAVLTALLAGPAAAAEQFQSAYTDLKLEDCSVYHSDDFGSSWTCPGYKGTPVYVFEGNIRFTVSFGLGANEEKAASQPLKAITELGPQIEWRLSNRSGGYRPIAAIVRYFVEGDDPDAQMLVVTQVKPGATCQIALVDAVANSDAEALARKVADEKAGNFDCAGEPEIVGEVTAAD